MANVRDVIIAGFGNKQVRTGAMQGRSKPAVRERDSLPEESEPQRGSGAGIIVSDTSEWTLRHLFESDEAHQKVRGEAPFRVNAFCEDHPVEAFEIATDILTRIADRTSEMVEESGRSLALMEARRERIDRLQAENRRMLDALVAGNPL
jgi:hypothetical protein